MVAVGRADDDGSGGRHTHLLPSGPLRPAPPRTLLFGPCSVPRQFSTLYAHTIPNAFSKFFARPRVSPETGQSLPRRRSPRPPTISG